MCACLDTQVFKLRIAQSNLLLHSFAGFAVAVWAAGRRIRMTYIHTYYHNRTKSGRVFRCRSRGAVHVLFCFAPDDTLCNTLAGAGSSESVALAGGVAIDARGVGGGDNGNGPILGRSDDWPRAWPGDTRPYFDYLLVVFSGDDREAMDKRDNMREVHFAIGSSSCQCR